MLNRKVKLKSLHVFMTMILLLGLLHPSLALAADSVNADTEETLVEESVEVKETTETEESTEEVEEPEVEESEEIVGESAKAEENPGKVEEPVVEIGAETEEKPDRKSVV